MNRTGAELVIMEEQVFKVPYGVKSISRDAVDIVLLQV